MSTKIFSSHSPQETQLLAGEILNLILAKKKNIIALKGELGSGKTTFIQGLARQLGVKEKVLSPTFVLMKKYSLDCSDFKTFYHIDCYRVDKEKEIIDLGFRKIAGNPENIVCIEWAEKIKRIIPLEALWLEFFFKDLKKREIKINEG